MTPERLRQHLLDAQAAYRGRAVRLVSRSSVVVPAPDEDVDMGPFLGPGPDDILRAECALDSHIEEGVEFFRTFDAPTMEDSATQCFRMDPSAGSVHSGGPPCLVDIQRTEDNWNRQVEERAEFYRTHLPRLRLTSLTSTALLASVQSSTRTWMSQQWLGK
jgi:hypothetical protein